MSSRNALALTIAIILFPCRISFSIFLILVMYLDNYNNPQKFRQNGNGKKNRISYFFFYYYYFLLVTAGLRDTWASFCRHFRRDYSLSRVKLASRRDYSLSRVKLASRNRLKWQGERKKRFEQQLQLSGKIEVLFLKRIMEKTREN